ncbi:MAG: DUF4442 domain-containing protein [Bdellovibrionales bacterium]|nr:DUF4442 domain-containing protein [Bdellovibrionales bacterium]
MKWKPWRVKLVNYWPPFLGSGIRVRRMTADFRLIEVELRQSWFNTNYVGVHFGGSLYAMTDPFYMLMLIENLGPHYIVWDKAAVIRFKRPGRGVVSARFTLSQEQIQEIQARVDREGKSEAQFQIQVLDQKGEVVAEVEKTIYLRRKDLVKAPTKLAPAPHAP